MTITQKITQAIDQFETIKRASNGEDIVVLKDTAPKALRNAVREAHGDRMPDDWIFSTFYHLLSVYDGYTIDSNEDLDDHRPQVVESCVDIYTANLTAWLAKHNDNVDYLTEALRLENGSGDMDGIKALSLAQYLAIDEIEGYVVDYLTKEE